MDSDHVAEQDSVGNPAGNRWSSNRGCVRIDAPGVGTAGVELFSGVYERWVEPVFSWSDGALGEVGEAQTSTKVPLDTG